VVKGQGEAAHYLEAAALPQAHSPRIRRNDEIELHGVKSTFTRKVE